VRLRVLAPVGDLGAVAVFNAMGQKVWEGAWPAGVGTMALQVGSWAPGWYRVEVREGGIWRGRATLLVGP